MQKKELINRICGRDAAVSRDVAVSTVSQPVPLSKGSGDGAGEARAAILADFLTQTTPEIPEGIDLSGEHFAALTRHVINLSAEAGDFILLDDARMASALTIQEAIGRLERLSVEHLQQGGGVLIVR